MIVYCSYYKIMSKNHFKAEFIEQLGPKFVIQPHKLNKQQVEQASKYVLQDGKGKRNPRISFYAQKFKKIQSRPNSSIPESSRQVPNTVGFRSEQPKNMGMMGSFFVNTKPNTRRISNSLANYHAQLMKRTCSQHRSVQRKNKFRAQTLSKNQQSDKNIIKKNSADAIRQSVMHDINEYFSLVKLSTYKRNEKKMKTNSINKAGPNSNFENQIHLEGLSYCSQLNNNFKTDFVVSSFDQSSTSAPIAERRYANTEIRTRQIEKEYFQNNMNIRGLRPNPIRYSHNPRPNSKNNESRQNRLQISKQKPELMIKLVTEELPMSNQEGDPKMVIQYRSTFDKQSPKKISKTSNIMSASPKKQRTKKKNTFLMDYLGKIKDNSGLEQIQKIKALYYRDLIWKVWFNSDWKVKIQSYSNSNTDAPRYFVGKGNNSKLVKALMGRRWWWKLQTKQQNANFLWTQLKVYSAYQSQSQYEPITKFETGDPINEQQMVALSPFQKQTDPIINLNQVDQSKVTEQLKKLRQKNLQQNELNFYLNDRIEQTSEKYLQNGYKQGQNLSPEIRQSCLQQDMKNDIIKISNLKIVQNTNLVFDEGWWNQKTSLNDKNSFIMTCKKYRKWEIYIKNVNNYKKEGKNSENLESRKGLQKDWNVMNKFPNKVTNHLQYSRLIGNKKALYKTMSMYYQLSKKISKFLPMTYHIISGMEDQQYLKFLNQYYRRSKQENNSMWIVKPGEMSNRGCGIVVCQDIQEIKKILKNKKTHANGKPFTYIIQEYLRDPFLYQGRKFDIRHYIMISSTFGRVKGYFYEQGYVRTTSYKYSNKTYDSSIHLTNDAVQKYCKQYGKYEKGNKLSYQDFDKYLKSLPEAKEKEYSFYQKILPKIRQISIDIINGSYYTIDRKRRGNNFQIFGLDIMIDSDFKPWLIQVNTNPCLELSSPVLAKVIPRMLDNAFALSLDPLFPPPSDLQVGGKKNNLPDNYISQNRFQLVFDQVLDGKKMNNLYEPIKDQLSQMDGFGSDQQAYESAEDDCAAQY